MKLIFGKTKRPDAPAEPKPPPPLSYCFMLSHLDEDGPVRLDGVKLGVCEVMGLELDEPKLGAVLLAVTPPRTGERTLLGVENLLQSVAVPEPFSLELAGDMDGVTLMARCLDAQVVRDQLSAHYPQARIQKVEPEDDPLRTGEGEQAWSVTLRADGPEYLPLRTFRDDDLLDPGSDPLIALMGALSALYEGERVVARLLLRSLGPDWSQAHMDKAHKQPGMEPREPAYTFQTKPLQMDGITMAVLGLGALAALKGYLWVQDGEIWKAALAARTPGDRRGPGAGGRRPGMAPLEEGPQARRGPDPDTGEGLPHRLRRRVPDRRRRARRDGAAARRGASREGRRRLPPLRQPRRRPLQGGQGPARPSRPGDAPPGRPRAVRQAQRAGRPRGRLPVAPARRRG